MSQKKIVKGVLDCYLDSVSPYSYILFEALLQYEPRLPLKLDFKPVFNGIIMKNAGNVAPAHVKSKGDQMWRDLPLCADFYGIPYRNVSNFGDRVMKKRSTPAMRFLTACKQTESEQTYLWAFRTLFTRLYVEDKDIFDKEDVIALFDEKKMPNRQKLYELMDANETRDALTKTTNEALNIGAYGVPWMTLKQDGKEPVQLFGSDRLHIVCHLLDVPFEGKLGDGIVKLDLNKNKL
ncbi:Glutathione S-transferase kappa 1-like protein [Aphelenchoides bicaudatus]|nr:Glutathione S-transferase kappa 1-like protein [Aphelenchoides bicaudatus]